MRNVQSGFVRGVDVYLEMCSLLLGLGGLSSDTRVTVGWMCHLGVDLRAAYHVVFSVPCIPLLPGVGRRFLRAGSKMAVSCGQSRNLGHPMGSHPMLCREINVLLVREWNGTALVLPSTAISCLSCGLSRGLDTKPLQLHWHLLTQSSCSTIKTALILIWKWFCRERNRSYINNPISREP